MNLKRLIKQIVRSTGLYTALAGLLSPEFRANRRLVRNLTRDISQAGLERISSGLANYPQASRKYLNLQIYLQEAVREARALKLLDSSGLRVLDIGCGTGYFLYLARRCGHDVLGLDLDDNALYNDVVRLLGLPRVIHRVERFKPLPDLGTPVDLITAFSICFDCHASEEPWGPGEWKYFIDDCLGHLSPRGRIFLRFNPATTHAFDFVPDKVAEMLRSIPGAHLSANKEEFLFDNMERVSRPSA